MIFTVGQCRVKISFWFLVLLSLFFLFDKSFIAPCLVLVIFLHELTHILFIKRFKVPINGLYLSIYGARLSCPINMLPRGHQAAVYLSAPLMNLILGGGILLLSPLSMTGIMSLAIGMYNLVPVRPLDGGNAAEALFAGRISEQALGVTAIILLIPVYIAAIYLAMYHQNYSMLICVIYLTIASGIRAR